jgi:hypothetical protein
MSKQSQLIEELKQQIKQAGQLNSSISSSMTLSDNVFTFGGSCQPSTVSKCPVESKDASTQYYGVYLQMV